MHIGFCAERREDFTDQGYTFEEAAELNTDATNKAIIKAIEANGHKVTFIGDIKALASLLVSFHGSGKGEFPFDLIYNHCEGIKGSNRESQVPALLEAYNIPFTFSSAKVTALCFDKGMTKAHLEHHGIPTAPWCKVANPLPNEYTLAKGAVVGRAHAAIDDTPRHKEALMKFPLFVKPTCEGTSKGIIGQNKVCNAEQLEFVVDNLCKKFPGQDILIESFLAGREITVGITGTGDDARVICVWETDWYKGRPDFYSLSEKTTYGVNQQEVVDEHMPDVNTDKQAKEACEVALKTWNALGCFDMGRIDLRFDKMGEGAKAHVMEVNTIAGMVPEFSVLPLGAREMGYSYSDLFGMIIDNARKRYNL